MTAVVARGTLVELLDINGVLQGAVLDKGPLRNLLVVFGQAHDEAEADLGVRIELACAEFDNIAHALVGAMLALDAIVSVEASDC